MTPADEPEVSRLRQEVDELRRTLDAIQSGDVDALVVGEGPDNRRVLALQDLRREATALEEAQTAAHLGSWEWDPVNDLTTLSKEGQRIWGAGPEPLRLPDFLARIHPMDTNIVNNFATDLLRPETPAPILVRLVSHGRETHVRVRGKVTRRDERGRPLRVAGTVEDVTEEVERLEAERRLRAEADAARETFQSIVESATDGIFQSTLPGEPQYVNPAALRILGYQSLEEFLASIRSVQEIYVDQADRGRFVQAVLAGQTEEFPTMLRRKDGGRVHVGLKAQLMTRPDGSRHLLGVMRDRTSEMRERALIEQRLDALDALRKSEESHRRLVEDTPVGIVRVTAEGRFLEANPAAVRILGFSSREDLLKVSALELYVRPQERRDRLELVNAGHERTTTEMRHSNGRTVWVRGRTHPIRDAMDQVLYYQGFFEDVTAEVQAEQERTVRRALEKERIKTLQILDQVQAIAKAGAWEYDMVTGKVVWTQEMYRIHEVPEEFVLDAANVMRLYAGPDRERMQAAQRELLATAKSYDLELALVTPRGTKKTLRTLAVPQVEGGKVVRILGYVADITDAKAAEAARLELERQGREVERLQELSLMRMEFLNNAAHDLNTPLTPLKIALAVFRLGSANLTPEQLETLDLFDRNVRRFQVLVQDMLDAGRIQGGRLKLRTAPTSLAALVEEAAASFADSASQAGLTLTMEPIPAVIANVDRDKTSQVVFNLVSNAVKYTPAGGITIRVEASSGEAVISVADTGLGLSKEQVAQLFQPFVRLHEATSTARGTGLGLYICKGIVEQQGGRIWAESDGPGKGSTFRLALPLDAALGVGPTSGVDLAAAADPNK
ncbi:MAG TPA: PAS domain S-box protein [Candidatus Thermoplasmatota archaeon]|nr:PAS domain S-box protein [Candidatus Thermoplasmatota archaeon]